MTIDKLLAVACICQWLWTKNTRYEINYLTASLQTLLGTRQLAAVQLRTLDGLLHGVELVEESRGHATRGSEAQRPIAPKFSSHQLIFHTLNTVGFGQGPVPLLIGGGFSATASVKHDPVVPSVM